MKQVKGFLLIEAAISLIILLLCLNLFVYCLTETRKIEANSQIKSDRAYAHYILKKYHLHKIKVHGIEYED
ncbi:hypothetical protein [Lactobacillus jensenii]|uniref:hypothetical protein n=1 Tax=Lactobacillus jensenii TaxID=109790 RepID=UPI001F094F64|nr:hypothetical protein [Lactobacillus jensenii]